MGKPIPKVDLYIMGYSAYWDGHAIYCVDGMFSQAQLEFVHAGYRSARDEGRKMLKEDEV